MIRHLKRNEIDIQKWNDCVMNSQQPEIFGCSQYLDVCFTNWSGLVLNNYEAVFPISKSSKFFINYIAQPFFVRYFGIYNSGVTIVISDWINELKKLGQYFSFDVFNLEKEFYSEFDAKEKVFQQLLLNNEYSELRSNYSEGHLRKLKKIKLEDFEIKELNNYQIFIDEFRTTVAEKKLNYSDTNLNTLFQLMTELPKDFSVISKGVFYNNQVVAGAYFIRYKNRLLYLKGFRQMNGVNDGSMFYLFDHIIAENCNQDLTLDFGGSNNTNVAQFFRGFGAEDSVYLHLEKNELPRLIKWLKK